MDLLVAAVGWIGAGLMLYAYARVSAGAMAGDGLPYQLINLAGSLALMVNTAYNAAWPSAILNVVWAAIGVVSIVRLKEAIR
ncbi:CBU_0592 family membrane protein [Nonomuraea recticatena]|uniref:CBU_0592 family membrane protein n=1 Tax=Nonomuraea recticatena TaxID=46178 RepID=UPI0031F854D3